MPETEATVSPQRSYLPVRLTYRRNAAEGLPTARSTGCKTRRNDAQEANAWPRLGDPCFMPIIVDPVATSGLPVRDRAATFFATDRHRSRRVPRFRERHGDRE